MANERHFSNAAPWVACGTVLIFPSSCLWLITTLGISTGSPCYFVRFSVFCKYFDETCVYFDKWF